MTKPLSNGQVAERLGKILATNSASSLAAGAFLALDKMVEESPNEIVGALYREQASLLLAASRQLAEAESRANRAIVARSEQRAAPAKKPAPRMTGGAASRAVPEALPASVKNSDPAWVNEGGYAVGPVTFVTFKAFDRTWHVRKEGYSGDIDSLCGSAASEIVGYCGEIKTGERTYRVCAKCRGLWTEGKR